MSNSNDDIDRLRSKVREVLFNYAQIDNPINLGESTDIIMQLLNTQTTRARIDELKRFYSLAGELGIDTRIEQLEYSLRGKS